jgi:hypothetical protein
MIFQYLAVVYWAQGETELLVYLSNLRVTNPCKTILLDVRRMDGLLLLRLLNRNAPGHGLHVGFHHLPGLSRHRDDNSRVSGDAPVYFLPPNNISLAVCDQQILDIGFDPDFPGHLAASSSFASAMTASGWNPNFFCNSLRGAEAPKVCMPIIRPVSPM